MMMRLIHTPQELEVVDIKIKIEQKRICWDYSLAPSGVMIETRNEIDTYKYYLFCVLFEDRVIH